MPGGFGMGGMGGMGGPGGGMGGGRGAGEPMDETLPAAVKEASQDAYSLFTPDAAADAGPDYGYARIRLHKSEEVSPYSAERDARFAMDVRKRNCIVLGVVAVLVFAAVIVIPDATYNTAHVVNTPARWLEDLGGNIQALLTMVSFGYTVETVQMQAKVCQFVICALAGAGLAVTGAMFQGALKNAMASPSTLGVMSGAQIGSVIYILLGLHAPVVYGVMSISDWQAHIDALNIFEYIWYMESQAIFSLIGAFVAVGLVVGVSFAVGRGKVSKSALIIAGTVFSSVVSGVVQFIRYYISITGDSDDLDAITSLATGSLSSWFTLLDVALAGVPILVCLVVLMRLRTRMNLLAFTDEEARSMGLSPRASRNLTIGVCTLLTGVIVAFCGSVAMVGFMVPHLVRKVVGPDFKYLVPASMLLGASFTMVAQCFSNQALSGMGMGSITGIIGAVAFIVSIVKQRRSGNADWV